MVGDSVGCGQRGRPWMNAGNCGIPTTRPPYRQSATFPTFIHLATWTGGGFLP